MQVHIEAESKTADHCRKYALGDEDCDHTHTEVCQQCLNLEEILDEILKTVEDSSWENKDAMLFQVRSILKNMCILVNLFTLSLESRGYIEMHISTSLSVSNLFHFFFILL